jgi:Flp pilus assembly pilin Flp
MLRIHGIRFLGYFTEEIMKKIKNFLMSKKGQNTVEYLLMLAVIVAVVLLIGNGLKSYMPELFDKIKGLISNAAQ